MLVHFRRTFEELNQAQTRLARLALSDYLEPTGSYVSMVELGLYESTTDTYAELARRNIKPHSEEWKREIEAVLSATAKPWRRACGRGSPRQIHLLLPHGPAPRRVVKNWYQEAMADRQRMMKEHGLIGRRYAGEVRQIITGSIGFDDWEWGVDLFAEEPLVFKKLIYEMRFDQVSAVYALFGAFYVGLRVAQVASI
jgi:hydrogen peroxide-dependent heme synthase